MRRNEQEKQNSHEVVILKHHPKFAGDITIAQDLRTACTARDRAGTQPEQRSAAVSTGLSRLSSARTQPIIPHPAAGYPRQAAPHWWG